MRLCESCPHLEDCHKDSIGNLQLMRGLKESFEKRDLMRVEHFVEMLFRRLREQHQKRTGR